MENGNQVKIIKGPYKNKIVILKRRDKINQCWYVVDKDGNMFLVEEKEIGLGK